MGVGRITGAREVTQGAAHAAHDGAGESAHRIAAIGAHAGREAQRTIAAGLGDAAKNIGDALKVVGDFAVKALWEKPIAEAEEKIRELDLKCRTEGWDDDKGHHQGFDLVRGAEAANIGEQWDAYMARKAKEFTKNLTVGQREELSRRTAKFRTETRARLTERGTVEAITSNLADIDAMAVKSGERNVMDAVERANEAAGYAEKTVGVTGNAEAGVFLKTQLDDAAAVSLSDALVEKRDKLIRDKVIGGLGRKSEAVATAEADKIVRAEALETVKALAAAGHYDRARKLVEQGGKLGFDEKTLNEGKELVEDIKKKNHDKWVAGVKQRYDEAEGQFLGNADAKSWHATVKAWSADPELQKADPKRAKKYADWAKAQEDAARTGKVIKYPLGKGQFKEEVEHKIGTWSMVANGLIDKDKDGNPLSPEAKAAYLVNLRREIEQDLSTGFAAKWLTLGEHDGLVANMTKRLDKRQKSAVMKLYERFGVSSTRLSVGNDGILTKEGLKQLEEQGDEWTIPGGDNTISTAALDKLATRVVSSLKALGNKADSEDAVDKVISRVHAEYLRDEDWDKAIERISEQSFGDVIEGSVELRGKSEELKGGEARTGGWGAGGWMLAHPQFGGML